MNIEIRRIQNPTYKRSEWLANADLIRLLAGEIGFEIPSGSTYPTKMKVGPGFWKDLPYFNPGGTYEYNDTVTNPIGDASGNLYGLSYGDILHKMLNPYAAPQITNLKNNASGVFESNASIEIGTVLSNPITVSYQVSNQGNLSTSSPIYASGSVFSNNGYFPVGNIALTLLNPLSSTEVKTYTISLKALHTNGESQIATTSFSFKPRIIWGSSELATLTSGDIANLSSKRYRISDTLVGDYNFDSTGYPWLLAPAMLSLTGLYFVDATYSELSAPFGLIDTGQSITYNNGVGTYAYRLLRGMYPLNDKTILRIKNG